jgi:hypothetical protein
MSKYKEMCDAAKAAHKRSIRDRDRCWGYLDSFVVSLLAYCEIPTEQIEFLRWNGEVGQARAYSPPESGGRYGLIGAARLDPDNDCWCLGVSLSLAPANSLLRQWIMFEVCATDRDGKPGIRMGSLEKGREIDFTNQSQLNEFLDDITRQIVLFFGDPKEPRSKTIGFKYSIENRPTE